MHRRERQAQTNKKQGTKRENELPQSKISKTLQPVHMELICLPST